MDDVALPAQDTGPIDRDRIETDIVTAMKTVYDPEIPVNIYDLGLIYEIDLHEDGVVDVKMTLTSPLCPAAVTLPPEVEMKVQDVTGVVKANLEIVWDPTWTPEMMTEAARLELGMF